METRRSRTGGATSCVREIVSEMRVCFSGANCALAFVVFCCPFVFGVFCCAAFRELGVFVVLAAFDGLLGEVAFLSVVAF